MKKGNNLRQDIQQEMEDFQNIEELSNQEDELIQEIHQIIEKEIQLEKTEDNKNVIEGEKEDLQALDLKLRELADVQKKKLELTKTLGKHVNQHQSDFTKLISDKDIDAPEF